MSRPKFLGVLVAVAFLVFVFLAWSFYHQRAEAERAAQQAAVEARRQEEEAQRQEEELLAFRAMTEADLRAQSNLCIDAIYEEAAEADLFNWELLPGAFGDLDEQIAANMRSIERGSTSGIGVDVTVLEVRSGFSMSQWLVGYRCLFRPDGTVFALRTNEAVRY